MQMICSIAFYDALKRWRANYATFAIVSGSKELRQSAKPDNPRNARQLPIIMRETTLEGSFFMPVDAASL